MHAIRRADALLFVGLWLSYGILINSSNLEGFNLQQMGIEALVERGRFYVDGSPTPQLQPRGDVFEHDGHLYAAKQPGQFLAGALLYAVLHLIGLSYYKNFLLTAALVTFFTASLVTAVAAVCVFRLAREWSAAQSSPLWALSAALSFGVASTAASYAGVAHHDAIASSYLMMAFYLVWSLSDGAVTRRRAPALRASTAGLLLGATITTSMLPFFMVLIVALYFLSLRRWQLVAFFVAGGVVGLTPLLLYNTISFGNPFLVPNLAGDYADTYFHLDWQNFLSKLGFYAKQTTLYVPIFWCGALGLAFLPRHLRREQLVLCGMLAALLGYVLNIETLGGCQYGPRYLLPAMPFVAVCITGVSSVASQSVRRSAIAIVGTLAVLSAAINLLGAMYGVMYCDLGHYGFIHYVAAIQHDKFWTYPLALWLVIPFGLWVVRVADALTGSSPKENPITPRAGGDDPRRVGSRFALDRLSRLRYS